MNFSLTDFMGTNCESNCYGHGLCNNQGRCQCFNGYRGPYCSERKSNCTQRNRNELF